MTIENYLEIRKFNHPYFTKYFRWIENHQAEKGDILAKFNAIAEIIGGENNGRDKNDLINLVQQPDSALSSAQMMRKVFHAAECDVYSIPRQIAEDLLNGMTVDQVRQKIYSYRLEMFFYTKPEYMPKDDDPDRKYWTFIRIMNLDDFLKVEVKDKDGKMITK
jgi:hypothetical protein